MNSCTSLVSLLFLKGIIQALSEVPLCIMIKQARMPNMIERRTKKKGGEKWYEKTKGKNIQYAKASEL